MAKTKAVAERSGAWLGGGDLVLPANQFRILYREYGWDAARKLSPQFIRWPEGKVPDDELYGRWAKDIDLARVTIPEAVERTFKKKLENMPKMLAFEHATATSDAAKTISRAISDLAGKLADGSLSEADEKRLDQLVKLSGMYQHANSGTGWVYDKLNNMSQKLLPQQQQVSIGRMTLNVGPRPKKGQGAKRPALPAGDVIEAEYAPAT